MSAAFFSCVCMAALLSDLLLPAQLYSSLPTNPFYTFFSGDFTLMVLTVFLLNLFLSALAVVTLPGALFFPLPMFSLLFRATTWGLMIHSMTNRMLLTLLPTLMLEGEAYALAAVAGTLLGASWLLPKRVYPGEDVTRGEAFRKALKETLRIYVLITILLLASAIVEAAARAISG